MVKVDYDYKWDALYVYKKGEKAKFSIEAFDNFVIDVGFDGKVVGLEVLNASKVLKVAKKELKTIKKAGLSTFMKGKLYGVIYSLQFKNIVLESELQVPVRGKLGIR